MIKKAMDYKEFEKLADHISSLMRGVMHQHENRFDIDSKIYRKDLFDDLGLFSSHMENQEAQILDLGCGKGHLTTFLAGMGYENLVGVDMDETTGEGGIYNTESLGAHWQKPLWNKFSAEFGLGFKFYDGKIIPFDEDSFDAIFLYAVIEHVDDPSGFLKECSRVLKPQGRIFIYRCPNVFSYTENLAKALGLPHHEKMYARKELLSLFASCGFDNLFLQRYDHFPGFCPIKSMQSQFDTLLSGVSKLDFIFRAPFINILSHHYRGVFSKSS